jgi:hypothetical protein
LVQKSTAGDAGLEAPKQLCIFLMTFICVDFFAAGIMAQNMDSFAPEMLRSPSEFHHPNAFSRPSDLDELGRSNDPNLRRYSSTGKPCIAVESFVTYQLINKNIYEHWIKASNSCGQHIRLQLCYHKTDDCIVMNVPPWESKNAVLGIQPGMKQFQFDAREK